MPAAFSHRVFTKPLLQVGDTLMVSLFLPWIMTYILPATVGGYGDVVCVLSLGENEAKEILFYHFSFSTFVLSF